MSKYHNGCCPNDVHDPSEKSCFSRFFLCAEKNHARMLAGFLDKLSRMIAKKWTLQTVAVQSVQSTDQHKQYYYQLSRYSYYTKCILPINLIRGLSSLCNTQASKGNKGLRYLGGTPKLLA